MSETSFFSIVANVLTREGFRPSEFLAKDHDGVSLHEAIRYALDPKGKPEEADVSYWNFNIMREFLVAVWRELDDVVTSRLGKKTSALSWSYSKHRGKEEVLEVLRQCRNDAIPAIPILERRPKGHNIPQSGKMIGAILETIGVIAESEDCGYGEVLSWMANPILGDEELLAKLDERCSSRGPHQQMQDKSTYIPRELGRAYMLVRDQRNDSSGSLSFSGFVSEQDVEANWEGLSNLSILKRLLVIAPEDSETHLKKISKLLEGAFD